MANCCGFDMKVQGRPEKVDEFVKLMDNKTSPFRIYSADLILAEEKDGLKEVLIAGDCAWSVLTSMRDGRNPSLESESKRLGIGISVLSEECGLEFQECFAVVKGEVIKDECKDWVRYDLTCYESIDELNEIHGTRFNEDDFDEDGYHEEGGIVWEHVDMAPMLMA